MHHTTATSIRSGCRDYRRWFGSRCSSSLSRNSTVHHNFVQRRQQHSETDASASPSYPPFAFKIAIVGSGPAGCYTAKYLQSALLKHQQQQSSTSTSSNDSRVVDDHRVIIDVLDRLPTIGGLVRYGVAPDHPEVKNVLNDFEALFSTPSSSANSSSPVNHASSSFKDRTTTATNTTATATTTTTTATTNSATTAATPTTTTTTPPPVMRVNHNHNHNHNHNKNKNKTITIQFFGGVQLGEHVQLSELRQLYDIVVLAYGCEASARLGVLGEDSLLGVVSAREFVNWYNGHPDFTHIGDQVKQAFHSSTSSHNNNNNNNEDRDPEDLDDPAPAAGNSHRSTTIIPASVVVIGHGNVALDCARILAKGGTALTLPQNPTDLPAPVATVLENGVQTVTVVGRRGHVQAAFTIKEVRELVHLMTMMHNNDADDSNDKPQKDPNTHNNNNHNNNTNNNNNNDDHNNAVQFIVSLDELNRSMNAATQAELGQMPAGRAKQRMDQLLRKAAAATATATTPTPTSAKNTAAKRIYLRFLLNPVRFEAKSNDPTRLGYVVCQRTQLVGPAGQQRAVPTEMNENENEDKEEWLPADLALISVGYRGVAVPGLEEWSFFDAQRGTVIHQQGRVDLPSELQPMHQQTIMTTATKNNNSNNRPRQKRVGGLYVSGWLKRGPSGIIGTNIVDAKETVGSILHDLQQLRQLREHNNKLEYKDDNEGDDTPPSPSSSSFSSLETLLQSRGVPYVDWDGYQRIIRQEIAERRSDLQPREKITSFARQMEIGAHRKE